MLELRYEIEHLLCAQLSCGPFERCFPLECWRWSFEPIDGRCMLAEQLGSALDQLAEAHDSIRFSRGKLASTFAARIRLMRDM